MKQGHRMKEKTNKKQEELLPEQSIEVDQVWNG
jgi:hypothetical protein